MKHGTPDSMKFKKLQRRLGVSVAVTVGTLELLWIAVQKNAKRGDIGQYSDEEIAIECDWDGDPEHLITALVDTGWLDRSEKFRLVVHDWQQHAPRYIHAWIKSQQTTFAVAEQETAEATTVPTIEATTVPTIEGGTRNLTKPNLTKPNRYTPGDAVVVPEKLNTPEVVEAVGRWIEHVNESPNAKTIDHNSPQEQALWQMLHAWKAPPDAVVLSVTTAIANSWDNLQRPDSQRTNGRKHKARREMFT